jgi:D-alanyl-D-alanine carboxypeptidase
MIMKKLWILSFFSGMTGILSAQTPLLQADSMLSFIKNNSKRASLFISGNDSTLAKLNEDVMMPLASTMKILVAVEFAKQAGAGAIQEDGYVAISELDKYYLENTDGGAHPTWLNYEKGKGHIKNDSVKLIDVARGMMIFSSNANTEYLLDLLGLDNVNSNIRSLNLTRHTAIFPLVSSLFMYQNPLHNKEKDVIKAIRALPEEAYCKVNYGIHYHLKNDSAFKSTFRPGDLTMKMQKLWSDRLPSSTAKEYVQLVKTLNKRLFLDENMYGILADILEFPMENPGFQKQFVHFGAKGGSTAFVLTHALYLTGKKGERLEMAIFFNNLTPQENEKLQRWLDPFEAQVIFKEGYWKNLKF